VARFGDECPIEVLRGERRLTPRHVKSVVARRAAWLQGRILTAAKLQEPSQLFYDDLACLAQLMEVYEAHHPAEVQTPPGQGAETLEVDKGSTEEVGG
jgi:hypothetical protein